MFVGLAAGVVGPAQKRPSHAARDHVVVGCRIDADLFPSGNRDLSTPFSDLRAKDRTVRFRTNVGTRLLSVSDSVDRVVGVHVVAFKTGGMVVGG